MNEIVVRISGQLRKFTGGKAEIELTGVCNISDCIAKLEEQFPDIKDSICDENGEIRNTVNIYVNGDNVRSLQGQATSLKAKDEVDILPAFAAA